MARPVILGNGALTVGLNEHGLVHDFYYPYVGLDNLTNARSTHHKIGVWVDDTFSWVESDDWNITVDFETDALVSNIVMTHEKLGIQLQLKDFVDSAQNAFCRIIEVTNRSDAQREIRLFLHQVFLISRSGRADTAIFVPDENYIFDYKGRCGILVFARDNQKQPYDQFAIGNYGIEGKEGTFKDAEDGELSGHAVEHGGVDSVIRFASNFESNQTKQYEYWTIAADSQRSAENIHHGILHEGLKSRLKKTKQYWHEWLATGSSALHTLDNKYLGITKKSMMLIKAHIDKRGGIIASCDSSIYNYGRDYYSYVWPRDGAYAIWPLIRLGYTDEPKKFFEFCRDILTPEGYLMHKYQPDKAIGSTWHPLLHGQRRELAIQEDETAIVLYMLSEYLQYSHDKDFVAGLYETLIKPAADFMANFIDHSTSLPHASYDLWEEKFLTNTYTVAITYQALLASAEFAEMFNYPDDAVLWHETAEKMLAESSVFFDPERKAYRKGYLLKSNGSLEFDNTLDISTLYGVSMFGFHEENDLLQETCSLVEQILLDQSPSGGTPRYENDSYFAVDDTYQGNPWFVTTLWIAQHYARINQTDKTRHYVDWTIEKALPSGVLSEQINPSTSEPLSVTPLVWSHAELINTILDISK